MISTPRLVGTLLCWLFVWTFWLLVTYRFHPTWTLALIVTSSLMCAYAAAAYCNHLVLVPRWWQPGKRWQYSILLVSMMALFTALALVVIRTSYLVAIGPDSDRYGWIKHFAIDLFGMVVHVTAAELVAWAACRLGWIRVCTWLLAAATVVCAVMTVTIISLQPNLEQFLKHALHGQSMPDAFHHMNKAIPVFLFFLTMSLAILRGTILRRRYSLVVPLAAGPSMCMVGLICTEDLNDPNWASMLAVVTIGMLVSCLVTAILAVRLTPRKRQSNRE